MNFFVDFEATQFSNGIIAIGCISDERDEFYTLVNTKHKITPFITNLTGIKPEEIDIAPEPELVFKALFNWIQEVSPKGDGKPKFYCYGNCDKEFVRNNFKECKDFQAASMLAYLYTDMHDYAENVKSHFGLCQHISLKKVYDYYTGGNTIQQHNALEDANMLRVVYENVTKNDHEFDAFPEYRNKQVEAKLKNESPILGEKSFTVSRIKSGKTIEIYPSLGAAVRWAYEQIPEGEERNKTSLKTIARGIRRAAKDPKKKYRNFKWTMIENK